MGRLKTLGLAKFFAVSFLSGYVCLAVLIFIRNSNGLEVPIFSFVFIMKSSRHLK